MFLSIDTVALLTAECLRVIHEAIKYFSLCIQPEQLEFNIIQSPAQPSSVAYFLANANRKEITPAITSYDPEAGFWDEPEILVPTVIHATHQIGLYAQHIRHPNLGAILLHEIAHAENFVRGRQDCEAEYHNKLFKQTAQRISLDTPAKPHWIRGFAFTTPGPRTPEFLQKICFCQQLFRECSCQ